MCAVGLLDKIKRRVRRIFNSLVLVYWLVPSCLSLITVAILSVHMIEQNINQRHAFLIQYTLDYAYHKQRTAQIFFCNATGKFLESCLQYPEV